MSNQPQSALPTAVLSGTMALLVAGASHAQDRFFKHDYNFGVGALPAPSSVVEFDERGQSLFLPGGATIGGANGPQGQPSSGSAASFGSAPTLTVTSQDSSPRSGAAPVTGGGGNGGWDDPCADDFFGEADRC